MDYVRRHSRLSPNNFKGHVSVFCTSRAFQVQVRYVHYNKSRWNFNGETCYFSSLAIVDITIPSISYALHSLRNTTKSQFSDYAYHKLDSFLKDGLTKQRLYEACRRPDQNLSGLVYFITPITCSTYRYTYVVHDINPLLHVSTANRHLQAATPMFTT
jgi:hypothetical protein